MLKIAEWQPKNGDVVLHCGHLNPNKPTHLWHVNVAFERPNGSSGSASWVVACNDCTERAGYDVTKVAVCGDVTWATKEAPN